jgi:hypothetical protein
LLASHAHAGLRFDHAGASVGLIVDHAAALEAVADAAQEAFWVSGLIDPQRPDAVRQKGCGDALANTRLDQITIEKKRKRRLIIRPATFVRPASSTLC